MADRTSLIHLLPASSAPSLKLNEEESPLKLKGWPTDARSLGRSWHNCVAASIGDIVLLLGWTFMLTYAFIVLFWDGYSTSNRADALEDIGKYSSTAFPILFAATVGRCLRSMAFWRLGRGERVGLLDQLIGSTSVVNTIITQYQLRRWSYVAIALVVVWILSPLGSQAVLRTVGIETQTFSQNGTFTYLSMNNSRQIVGPLSDHASFVAPADTLFLAAFMSPADIKSSSMDSYRNVKIPYIHRIRGISSSVDGEWLKLGDRSPSMADYSALLGIPIARWDLWQNSTFNIETSYWTLDCPIVVARTNRLSNNSGSYADGPSFSIASNTSRQGPKGYRSEYNSALVSSANDSSINLEPRQILYSGNEYDKATYAECYLKSVYVEVRVSCLDLVRNCSVVQMRPSQKLHPPSGWSQLDDNTYNNAIQDFFTNFAAVIPGRKGYPSLFTNYFLNPASPYDMDPGASSSYKSVFDQTTPSAFADSFAQLMNTYYLASIGSSSMTVSGRTRFDRLLNNRLANGTVTNTTGTYSKGRQVVKCNRAWFAVLLVASWIPFAATILIMTLEGRRQGPALSMNISTLLRESALSGLPVGAGTLDDADRSRATRNVKVRLGDVQSQDDVGRIAIGRIDKVSRLSRRRQYI